ncbi:helix-turn-helix domain-containing protein [Teichococcus aestuarii]|uniref:Helix-turn-helix domain-containing protein n=1 Tax=Teichococcus aestuarii TaxID=568898 RepID=A0A2U1UXJ0_9PROT|nr:helix-turn-helix domain-containing protein [Pseudoroseomonas aestuarii]PWC26396.1 hypothetical protein CR165_23465 [Pseudoroseomonas aestuarii]
MLAHPHPARPGSVRADRLPAPVPLPMQEAARIMRQAEAHPGIDALALRLLRVMIFELGGARVGACTHALEAIARRAKISRATVVRRLRLLVAEGFIERTRRAVLVDARAGWKGAARLVQATTLYAFRSPPARQDRPHAAMAASRPIQPPPAVPRSAPRPTLPTPPAAPISAAHSEPPMSIKLKPPLPPALGWRARLAERAAREAEALERALSRLGGAMKSRGESGKVTEISCREIESHRENDGNIRYRA